MTTLSPLDLVAPSERLLDHYKKKTNEWKGRVVNLISQVEDCKVACAQYADCEIELQKREIEVSKLKNELSDVKRSLFAEREHVMKLVDDKDKLRLELLDSRRMFKSVLDALGLKECEVIQFLETPKKGLKDDLKSDRIKRGVKKILQLGLDADEKMSKLKEDLQAYDLRIKLLESQLEEQHCLFKDEINDLLEERRNVIHDREEERKRFQHRISCLNCRLEGARKKICDNASRDIQKQSESIDSEVKLMMENEKLMKCLIICKELLGEDFPSDLDDKRPKKLKDELIKLQNQLSEKAIQITTFKNQNNLLKLQINKMQENTEAEEEKFSKEKVKWQEKYDLLVKRYDKEHKRRVLEAEGFRSDIKLLRSSLQSVQRQIRLREIRDKCDEEGECKKEDTNDGKVKGT